MTIAFTTARRACMAQMVWESPLGPLLLARTDRGLAGAWFEGQRHQPSRLEAPARTDDPLLQHAAEQLRAYFGGAEPKFDVPLDLQGTEFQCAVWQALLGIGAGATCTYSDIAQRVGRPSAMRAVGAAIGRNPVGIIVPCHRVVGSSGALTGYAAGLPRKLALLQHEARWRGGMLRAETSALTLPPTAEAAHLGGAFERPAAVPS